MTPMRALFIAVLSVYSLAVVLSEEAEADDEEDEDEAGNETEEEHRVWSEVALGFITDVDSDGDGKITQEELVKGWGRGALEELGQSDFDLVARPFRELLAEGFKTYDVDEDNKVDSDEMAKLGLWMATQDREAVKTENIWESDGGDDDDDDDGDDDDDDDESDGDTAAANTLEEAESNEDADEAVLSSTSADELNLNIENEL